MKLTQSSDEMSLALCQQLYDYLDQLKAIDIVSISLLGKSSLADYMLIASGTSQRHISSIAEKIKEFLHEKGIKDVHVEGLQVCDWILVDGGDVIIHLFRPEIRQFYNLEKMWSTDFSGPTIDKAIPK